MGIYGYRTEQYKICTQYSYDCKPDSVGKYKSKII